MELMLFRGTKTFWKTKNSIDIAIIAHPGYDVIEVLAFEPILKIEAPRAYLDAVVLQKLLGIEINLEDNSESHYSTENQSKISTFIYNHIYITTYLPVSKIFDVEVYATYHREKSCQFGILTIERPSELPIIASPFACLTSFWGKNTAPARITTLREKWRIPLIMVQISKGLPLRESDTKIWTSFVSNKTSQELVNSITIALHERIPTESKETLRSIAQAVIIPNICPFPPSSRGPSPSLSGRSSPYSSTRGNSTVVSRTTTPEIYDKAMIDKPYLTLSAERKGLPPRIVKKLPNNSLRPSNSTGNLSILQDLASVSEKSAPHTAPKLMKGMHRRNYSESNSWPSMSAKQMTLSSSCSSTSTPNSPLHSPRKIVPTVGIYDEDDEEDGLFSMMSLGLFDRKNKSNKPGAIAVPVAQSSSARLALLRLRQQNSTDFSDDEYLNESSSSTGTSGGIAQWAAGLMGRGNNRHRVSPGLGAGAGCASPGLGASGASPGLGAGAGCASPGLGAGCASPGLGAGCASPGLGAGGASPGLGVGCASPGRAMGRETGAVTNDGGI